MLKISELSLLKMLYQPDYDGKGFYNLSQSLIEFFGGKTERKGISYSIPNNENLALFLFDAMGISTLEKAGLLDHPHEEITSVFPSTTATALTTLFTGKTPAEHGVLGFMTFTRETGGVVNMLGVAHPMGPQLPINYEKLTAKGERLGKKLSSLGVSSVAVLPKSLSNTPMSNFDDEGFSATMPYYDFWDLKTIVNKELSKKGRRFLYVYVPYVDTLSHHYGPYSEEAKEASKDLLNFFEAVTKSAKDFTILGTADHGQVEVDPAQAPPQELLSLLEVPPYGDSRAMFLKTRYVEKVKNYLLENYPEFYMIEREDVLKQKLLGLDSTAFPERLGDLLVLPQSRRLLIYPYTDKEANESFNYKGHHGGLSPEEVKIPLFIRP